MASFLPACLALCAGQALARNCRAVYDSGPFVLLGRFVVVLRCCACFGLFTSSHRRLHFHFALLNFTSLHFTFATRLQEPTSRALLASLPPLFHLNSHCFLYSTSLTLSGLVQRSTQRVAIILSSLSLVKISHSSTPSEWSNPRYRTHTPPASRSLLLRLSVASLRRG